MKVRAAQTKDASILSSLAMSTQISYANNRPDYFKLPEHKLFAESYFNQLLDTPDVYLFVAEEDQQLYGYIFSHVVKEEENPYNLAPMRMHIEQIAVYAHLQGQGCGEALIRQVMKLARQLDIHYLSADIWRFNQQANHFFVKHGFETVYLHMWRKVNHH